MSFRVNALLAFASLTVQVAAFGGTIVVPNAQTNSEGNQQISSPDTTPDAVVLEQLYDQSQFSGPITITELSFRAADAAVTTPVGGHAAVTNVAFGNLSVYLSTSSNDPGSISSTFADNIGADNTLVFSGTNVNLSEAVCAGSGVCPFDLDIDLTTPFTYDPSLGSLSLELIASGFEIQGFGQGYGQVDGESGSSAVAVDLAVGSTTATIGSVADIGFITQFTPTPEPGTWMMAVAGVAGLISLRRKLRASN